MTELEHAVTLADDHWSYINRLLEAHGASEKTRQVVGFHYKSAFVHGFKHGCEYMREITDIDLILESFAEREFADDNDENRPA